MAGYIQFINQVLIFVVFIQCAYLLESFITLESEKKFELQVWGQIHSKKFITISCFKPSIK